MAKDDGENSGPRPSIKLVQPELAPPGLTGSYKVIGLVDTVKFAIGDWITKAQVQELIADGLYKITVK